LHQAGGRNATRLLFVAQPSWLWGRRASCLPIHDCHKKFIKPRINTARRSRNHLRKVVGSITFPFDFWLENAVPFVERSAQCRRREGIQPGVKCSETPGTHPAETNPNPAKGWRNLSTAMFASPLVRGFFCSLTIPGVPPRSTPGLSSGAPSGAWTLLFATTRRRASSRPLAP
jgi:hypothetical protein